MYIVVKTDGVVTQHVIFTFLSYKQSTQVILLKKHWSVVSNDLSQNLCKKIIGNDDNDAGVPDVENSKKTSVSFSRVNFLSHTSQCQHVIHLIIVKSMRQEIYIVWNFPEISRTRIRSMERGMCPIAAVCTVLLTQSRDPCHVPFPNFFSGHVSLPGLAWEQACQIRSLNL